MFKKISILFVAAVSLITLSSCRDQRESIVVSPQEMQAYSSNAKDSLFFDDLVFPDNTMIDSQRTVLYNKHVSGFWYGNIYGVAPYSIRGVFNFYMSEMPKLGWKVLSYSQEKTGNIAFERDGRLLQLTLKDAGARGTYIDIVVSIISN
jgi:hypothetical protein